MEQVTVEKLRASHRKIYTDILIDAAPEQVWAVLADTSAYSDWAVFIVDIKGELVDGNEITVVFQIDPRKEKFVTLPHTIHVTDGEEFYWAEKGPGGIWDNHHFRVEPAEGGKTRFIHSDELMKGITWLMGGRFSKLYAEGYQAFNRALKQEVARRAATTDRAANG